MKRLNFLFCLFFSVNIIAQTNNSYTNPILAGFYPDPSICKAGNAYYLVNSTFAYFPGIPVFKSFDLAHWKQIGYVINRASQMNFMDMGISRGIFAPSIRYHNGTFYVTCTQVDGKGNFICTTKNPEGEWSNPVWLPEVNGIDPSLFFDDNNKAYIVYNSIPPDNKELYNGHRTIRINEFDATHLKIISDNKILVNGGTDISLKPAWIEGPHIFKKDGKYFLMAAQGGTGFDHSEVIFKSDSVFGTYIPFEKNPILTQKNLDPNRKYPITSTGHADLVETKNGKWMAVFLGCRPYEGDYYNTGRETFLAPVEWIDGWPIIIPKFEAVQYHYTSPLKTKPIQDYKNYGGNFSYKDDFDKSVLQKDWMFLRTSEEKWYQLKNGKLFMQLQATTCSERKNPSFIGKRQQHIHCTASTSLAFFPKNENEKAGLLIFQNEQHYYFLAITIQNNKPCVQLIQSSFNGEKIIASKEISQQKKPVQLKIKAEGSTYSFHYSLNNKNWILLADNVDGKFLSTKIAGGFVGSFFALYATSNGNETTSTAAFDWFLYQGKDESSK